MIKPNFFIIGAPKCGTTSLAMYLRSHPGVFMSALKEPNFFNTDMLWRGIHSQREYLDEFKFAQSSCTAIGEASAIYLFSKVAVPNILTFDSNARFIVMLRNPLEMAHSLYLQYLWAGQENQGDFRAAWELQKPRAHGKQLPILCKDPLLLQYKDICSLGTQLERLFNTVKNAKLHVVLYDDFTSNPKHVYRDVLKFLDLADDGRSIFETYNRRRKAKWSMANRLFRSVISTKECLEHFTGIRTRFGILSLIETYNERFNAKILPQASLDSSFRDELAQEFREEVVLLSGLLNRDLNYWLMSPNEGKKATTRLTTDQIEGTQQL